MGHGPLASNTRQFRTKWGSTAGGPQRPFTGGSQASLIVSPGRAMVVVSSLLFNMLRLKPAICRARCRDAMSTCFPDRKQKHQG